MQTRHVGSFLRSVYVYTNATIRTSIEQHVIDARHRTVAKSIINKIINQ